MENFIDANENISLYSPPEIQSPISDIENVTLYTGEVGISSVDKQCNNPVDNNNLFPLTGETEEAEYIENGVILSQENKRENNFFSSENILCSQEPIGKLSQELSQGDSRPLTQDYFGDVSSDEDESTENEKSVSSIEVRSDLSNQNYPSIRNEERSVLYEDLYISESTDNENSVTNLKVRSNQFDPNHFISNSPQLVTDNPDYAFYINFPLPLSPLPRENNECDDQNESNTHDALSDTSTVSSNLSEYYSPILLPHRTGNLARGYSEDVNLEQGQFNNSEQNLVINNLSACGNKNQTNAPKRKSDEGNSSGAKKIKINLPLNLIIQSSKNTKLSGPGSKETANLKIMEFILKLKVIDTETKWYSIHCQATDSTDDTTTTDAE